MRHDEGDEVAHLRGDHCGPSAIGSIAQVGENENDS
jgi:hypothetical protein